MIRNFMKNTFWGMCVCAFFLMTTTMGRTQGVVPRAGDLSVSAFSNNQDGIDGKKHVGIGAAYTYNLSRSVSVAAEYSYQGMGSVSASIGGYSVSGSERYQKFGGAARWNLGNAHHIVPYFVVGAGYLHGSARASVSGYGSASASGNGDYAGGGGGINLFLTRNMGIRPEFRYERGEFYSNGQSAGTNVPVYGASVFFQFGGKAKSSK